MNVDLLGMDLKETEVWALERGLAPYRAGQIRSWIFKALVDSFDEMTDLSKSVRAELTNSASLRTLEEAAVQVSTDGTRKYLFRLLDGAFIESVLIPERGHYTLCISSQAGCAMGCLFCLTGKQGLKRNLRPSEIVEQVIRVKRSLAEPDRLTNVVLMGMGEPLANYDSVLKALGNLIHPDGMDFSHRRVTLSTCGLAPQIRRLGRDITVSLAVSLNAADNPTRSSLMPVKRRYPLEGLMAACRDFPLPTGRRITFEYILLDGINDRPEDAERLVVLLSGLRAKINLIALNPHPGLDMAPSPQKRVLAFQEILVRNHYTAILRKSKGQDISAACGQLSGMQAPSPLHSG
jgi:23S rRNA (adenine2503-C2)-methyltransferase